MRKVYEFFLNFSLIRQKKDARKRPRYRNRCVFCLLTVYDLVNTFLKTLVASLRHLLQISLG